MDNPFGGIRPLRPPLPWFDALYDALLPLGLTTLILTIGFIVLANILRLKDYKTGFWAFAVFFGIVTLVAGLLLLVFAEPPILW